jgi:hypothetical protein
MKAINIKGFFDDVKQYKWPFALGLVQTESRSSIQYCLD